MSLKELYEIQAKVNEAIREKTRFKRKLQEGVGKDNGVDGIGTSKSEAERDNLKEKPPDIIPFDEE